MLMNKNRKLIKVLGLIFLGLFLCNANPAALPSLEKPPIVKASELVSSEILQGTDYTIEPNVNIEGYFGKFVLNTQWGAQEVRGAELLKLRISELPAIKELKDISKTEVFAKSAAAAAAKPIKSLKNVAEDPAGTVKGIPSGVGRFFKRTAKAVEKGVDAVKDKDSEKKDESQQKGSSGEAVKEISGYNKILREWARNLEVDPYTTNPILKKELANVAKASFAGGFTTKVAIPKAPRPIRTVVRISNMVWDMPPEDLQELNEKNLKVLGASEESIKAFIKNTSFTPTTATAFVLSLEGMKGVSGIDKAVVAASNADSEDEAHFFVLSAHILVAYHRKFPVSELATSGLVIFGRTRNGKLVVPAGVDYVSWTDEIQSFAQREELKASERVILLSGKVSPAAKQGFTALGWQLQEKATSSEN
jgi:hypothetical protein